MNEEVDVVNQYYQVTGTRTDTVVVRAIPGDAPTRLVSGIPAGEPLLPLPGGRRLREQGYRLLPVHGS